MDDGICARRLIDIYNNMQETLMSETREILVSEKQQETS